jgi:hypothetical protein
VRVNFVLSAGVTLAVTATAVGAAIGAGPVMGPAKTVGRPAFQGYYDGHRTRI